MQSYFWSRTCTAQEPRLSSCVPPWKDVASGLTAIQADRRWAMFQKNRLSSFGYSEGSLACQSLFIHQALQFNHTSDRGIHCYRVMTSAVFYTNSCPKTWYLKSRGLFRWQDSKKPIDLFSLNSRTPAQHSAWITAISLVPSFSSKNVTDLWKKNKHQPPLLSMCKSMAWIEANTKYYSRLDKVNRRTIFDFHNFYL